MDKFLNDIDKLNIDRPEIIARATDHIDVMEKERLCNVMIENGYELEVVKQNRYIIQKVLQI